MRIFLSGIVGIVLAISAQTVPFIGCKSEGQTGPVAALRGTTKSLPITRKAAQELAYYQSEQGMAVLAPRGWYCFGVYGSGGESLLVSSQPIDTAHIFEVHRDPIAGPAIAISYRSGDTSGRFNVAEIIARVFPANMAFATAVMKDFDLANPYQVGPYPNDTVTYKSKRTVEYKTPAQTDGLGTYSWLEKNGSPIEGVAMLIGKTPDLLILSVRLPPELNHLTPAIVHETERDAPRLAH